MEDDHTMTPAATATATATALLVIDVQRALCSGPYAVFEAPQVIARINHVASLARRAGAPVIVVQHEEPASPMAHGAKGWQLAEGLATESTDIPMRKAASDSFHETPLQALLQARGVAQLVVCGMQTDFCVDTTIRRALALGYPVTLVADGHSTLANSVLSAEQIIAHHNETLSNINSFGPRVRLVPAAEVRFGH